MAELVGLSSIGTCFSSSLLVPPIKEHMRQHLKRVGILGFEGAHALDIVGPLEAFANPGRRDPTAKESRGNYDPVIIGLSEKPFAAESALYIKDGRYYTSGGITAGIDLALALIEEDLGAGAALAVARELV